MKKLAPLLVLILFMTGLVLSTSHFASGWDYQKTLNVTEKSNNSLSSYSLNIDVDTAQLIQEGKLNDDCNDLRFTEDGNSINHWLESGCNSTSTSIWLRLDSVPADSTEEIVMYYGNPEASSTSDSDNIFEFYDDFNGTDLNSTNWYFMQGSFGNGNYDVQNSRFRQTRSYARARYNLSNEPQSSTGTMVEWRYKWQASTCYGVAGTGVAANSTVGGTFTGKNCPNDGKINFRGTDTGVNPSTSYDVYELTEFNGTWSMYKNNNQIASTTTTDSFEYVWVGSGDGSPHDTTDHYIDYYQIRDYVSPEPSYSVGAEEMTNSAPSTPTNPQPVDGGSEITSQPRLNVSVSDPDGDEMNVTFYDGSDGSVIGKDIQTFSGGTASVEALEFDQVATGYSWYVVSSDGEAQSRGPSTGFWSFQTETVNRSISVTSGNNTNYGLGTAEIEFSPEYNGQTIDSVRLLYSNGTQIGERTDVESGGLVRFQIEGLKENREYEWRAELENNGDVFQSGLASFTTLNVDISLSQGVEGAKAYNIYRVGNSADSANFNYGKSDYSIVGSGDALNLVDGSSGLETGQSYCYVITSENLGGESPGSNEMCTSNLVLNP